MNPLLSKIIDRPLLSKEKTNSGNQDSEAIRQWLLYVGRHCIRKYLIERHKHYADI